MKRVLTILGISAVMGIVLALAWAAGHGGRAEDQGPKPGEKVAGPGTASGELPSRVRWKADAMIMVKVPAGPFWMGSNQMEAEKPRRQENLPVYYLEQTEQTFRNYLVFCQQTGRQPPVLVLLNKPFPEELMDHPVSDVSGDDADAYCRWAGKRLPTEAEFEKACAGEKGQTYCWGNNWDPNACTNRINSGDQTTRVGARPSCKSPYGIMDLSGNVWEWTTDWYKSYPGAPLQFDYTGSQRVARGGAFFYSIDLLRCANRYPLPPDNIAEQGGFRCAATPDQGFAEKTAPP